MKKELIIFDADGTLTNTNEHFVEAYLEAFQSLNRKVDPGKLLSMIGMGHDQAIPLLTSKEWYDRYGEAVVAKAKDIYLARFLKKTRLFPGAAEIMRRLRAMGKKVAVASSSQREVVEFYMTLFPEGPGTFSAMVSFDDVMHSKPHPELFLKILEKLAVPPERTVTVGDSAWDMQASGRAKIDGIGVLSGGTPETELKKHGAKEVYRHLGDLLEQFEQSLVST